MKGRVKRINLIIIIFLITIFGVLGLNTKVKALDQYERQELYNNLNNLYKAKSSTKLREKTYKGTNGALCIQYGTKIKDVRYKIPYYITFSGKDAKLYEKGNTTTPFSTITNSYIIGKLGWVANHKDQKANNPEAFRTGCSARQVWLWKNFDDIMGELNVFIDAKVEKTPKCTEPTVLKQLTTNAENYAKNYNKNKTVSVKFKTNSVPVQVEGKNYKLGPYQLISQATRITKTVTDEKGNKINNATIKGDTSNFYVYIPITSNISKIKVNVNAEKDYNNIKGKLWFLESAESQNFVVMKAENEKLTNKASTSLTTTINPGNYNFEIIKTVGEETTPTSRKATFIVNNEEKITNNGEVSIDKKITQPGVDTYTIIEKEAPEGCEKYNGTIIIKVTTKLENNKLVASGISWETTGNKDQIKCDFNKDTRKITLELNNPEITGNYGIRIRKKDNSNHMLKDSEATFTVNGNTDITTDSGIAWIEENKKITDINEPDVYTIVEKIAPEGYKRFEGTITITIPKKKTDDGKYVIDISDIDLEVKDKNGEDITNTKKVNFGIDGTNIVSLSIKNELAEDKYNVSLLKVDENKKEIEDSEAKFKIEKNGETKEDTTVKGNLSIENGAKLNKDNVAIPDVYIIKEIQSPVGYTKFNGTITLNVEKKVENENTENEKYIIDQEKTIINVTDENGKDITATAPVELIKTTNTITIMLKNTSFKDEYNVKLLKTDEKGNVINSAETKFNLNGKEETTKEGLLTIANACKITKGNVKNTDKYVIYETEAPVGYDKFEGIITLDVAKKISEDKTKYELDLENTKLKVVDSENKDITTTGIVSIDKTTNTVTLKLKNKAFEGDYDIKLLKTDENQKVIEESETKFKINDDDKITTKGVLSIVNDNKITKDNVGKVDQYVINEIEAPNGYTKFNGTITLDVAKKVDGDSYIIDTEKTQLKVVDEQGKDITGIGIVSIDKEINAITLKLKNISLGKYNIELIKEDANGENLTDPAEFEVTNKQTEETKTKTTENSKLDITDGSVEINEDNINDIDTYIIKETKAPDKYCEFNGIITLAVTKAEENGTYIVKSYNYNVTDENGNDITEQSSDAVTVEFVNGNLYVHVKDYQFDLALRKFIVQVNDTELKTTDGKKYLREPEVDTSKLNTTDEKGNMITTATYNHPKTPVEVKKGDTVIYMLRVYNEGEVDGYATEIKDHLPSYLEFVKGDFNNKYKWQVSEDGRTVTSKYLENELIAKATDKDGKIVLAYKEVPIMCKVKDTAKTQEAITNIADITKCKDKDKNDVTDRDSTPDNVKLPTDEELPKYKENEKGQYVPGQEDDDDFEKVIIYQFDLALRKWVTQAIVIENGKEAVTNTGHDAWDDPEDVVKVDLNRRKLNDVTVKFKYSIRVYNQGDVEGYAKEITDYVPEGLKFVAEDNPNWTDEGNNVISTRLLENTLLKPGEYADVEVVLTWINGKDNIGLKTNVAEISEDYNDKGLPDRDSTPDNRVWGEDDIDDAPVILAIATGKEPLYIGLGLTTLAVLAGGVFLIKKRVL